MSLIPSTKGENIAKLKKVLLEVLLMTWTLSFMRKRNRIIFNVKGDADYNLSHEVMIVNLFDY